LSLRRRLRGADSASPDPRSREDPIPTSIPRDETIALLADLVRIPSVNPVLAPDEPHGEGRIAVFIRDWLATRGLDARLEEVAPGRPNVVAEIAGGDGPALVFCGHIDTVGTAGMTIPPFEPRLEGGRLHGRGSFDMKGGVAAVLAAGVALARGVGEGRPLHGTVRLALVADEELTSLGADHFAAHHRAGGCILAEPTAGQLILAHKGFVWATVRTVGRAAHGSRWDLGKSAIGAMGRVIAALDAHDAHELRTRSHPLVGPASMHCALVQGGAGLSTYAPECVLRIERRTLPGESPDDVIAELRRVFRHAGETAEVALDVARPPMSCDPRSRLANKVREAVRSVTGSAPEEAGVGYWTDAAIFAGAGIPALIYGPSGEGAHEAVEWVDVDSVLQSAEVYAEAARRFCSSDDDGG
jgi:acetylornithine deacetylase/succinyl-diaminopimelate desuccinylase family protein